MAVTPRGALTRWAEGLRFPRLFLLTTVLFVVDVFLPDMVPFADEILLGLVAVILGRLRRERKSARGARGARG